MESLGKRLRARAAELGMTNAAVARAAGVSEQRYGNYVTDVREPDLATFVRIAKALRTSPNDLLGFDVAASKPRTKQRLRLLAAAERVPDDALAIVTVQLEALAEVALRPRKQ